MKEQLAIARPLHEGAPMSTSTSSILNGLTTGTWAIDPTHSEVGFVARHLMVSKVRGSFSDVSGTVEVADELADSVATVAIQTASVSTGSPV